MSERILIHPGEILREEFLVPMGITACRLTKEIQVPVPRIHDIVLEKRGISADTALRLGRCFNMSARFWMNLQTQLRVAGRGKGGEAGYDRAAECGLISGAAVPIHQKCDVILSKAKNLRVNLASKDRVNRRSLALLRMTSVGWRAPQVATHRWYG